MFTIHQCGFDARCALEAEDSGEVRIRKIKRLIRECGIGVHDISRVQLDSVNQLPRFNMPLELGLFLGAQEYGSAVQKQKRSLILDSEPYRYQKFCSDIAGQDVRAHHDEPARIIAAVRAMLSTALQGRARIPGESRIPRAVFALSGGAPRHLPAHPPAPGRAAVRGVPLSAARLAQRAPALTPGSDRGKNEEDARLGRLSRPLFRFLRVT